MIACLKSQPPAVDTYTHENLAFEYYFNLREPQKHPSITNRVGRRSFHEFDGERAEAICADLKETILNGDPSISERFHQHQCMHILLKIFIAIVSTAFVIYIPSSFTGIIPKLGMIWILLITVLFILSVSLAFFFVFLTAKTKHALCVHWRQSVLRRMSNTVAAWHQHSNMFTFSVYYPILLHDSDTPSHYGLIRVTLGTPQLPQTIANRNLNQERLYFEIAATQSHPQAQRKEVPRAIANVTDTKMSYIDDNNNANNACHGRVYSEGVPHQLRLLRARDGCSSELERIKCVDANSNNYHDSTSVNGSVEGNGEEKEFVPRHHSRQLGGHHQCVGVTLDNISLLSGMLSDARSDTNEVAVTLENVESDDDGDSDDETTQFASYSNINSNNSSSNAMSMVMMNGSIGLSIGGLKMRMQGDSARLKSKTIPESPVQPGLFVNPTSISMIPASCHQ